MKYWQFVMDLDGFTHNVHYFDSHTAIKSSPKIYKKSKTIKNVFLRHHDLYFV